MKTKQARLVTLWILGVCLCVMPVGLFASEFTLPFNPIEGNSSIQVIDVQTTQFSSSNKWGYTVIHEDGYDSLSMNLGLDDQSVQGLEAYKQYNDALGVELSEVVPEMEVIVTFDTPLSVAETNRMLREYNFGESTVNMRQIGHDGSRVTATAFIEDGGKLFVASDNSTLFGDGLQQSSFKGVVSIHGTINSDKYAPLVEELSLFMVDVTPTKAKLQFLNNQTVLERIKQYQFDDIDVTPTNVYWSLEDSRIRTLPIPQNVYLTEIENGYIQVAWEYDSSGDEEIMFDVYNRTDLEKSVLYFVGSTSSNSIIDVEPIPGLYYMVEAYTLNGERSMFSDPVQEDTPVNDSDVDPTNVGVSAIDTTNGVSSTAYVLVATVWLLLLFAFIFVWRSGRSVNS